MPISICYLSNEVSISGTNRANECPRWWTMNSGFLLYLAPPSTLAIKHSNHARAFVQVPYLEQAGDDNLGIWAIKKSQKHCMGSTLVRKLNKPGPISCWINKESVNSRPARQLSTENWTIIQNQFLEKIKIVLSWLITVKATNLHVTNVLISCMA